MQNILLYVLLGLVVVLVVIVIIMLTKFDSLKKEVWESAQQAQAGTAALQSNIQSAVQQTVSQSYANINQAMSQSYANINQNLETKIAGSYNTVRESLDSVYKEIGEMQSIANGVGDLKKVLSNVKTRGILGEIQLGNILKDIMAPGQYEENVITVPGSSARVEFAVKLPGGEEGPIYLPIDSKFPGDAYAHLEDAYEAADQEAVETCKKVLIQQFKSEAKDIATKYVKPPYTTDFGIMFLPFEGLYAEAVNMGMIELLQNEYSVMLAGPSTMAAMLNSLQMGFRTLAIQKNADTAWKVLADVKSEFDSFEKVLSDTRNRLKQADDELDKLVGVRTRQIQKALKDVQTPDYR